MIQIRHVPEALHRKLKARAAMEGMTLSDYLRREVEMIAERPTLAEMRERLARRKPVILRPSPAALIRAERDRR
jgi:hypothetical protein